MAQQSPPRTPGTPVTNNNFMTPPPPHLPHPVSPNEYGNITDDEDQFILIVDGVTELGTPLAENVLVTRAFRCLDFEESGIFNTPIIVGNNYDDEDTEDDEVFNGGSPPFKRQRTL